MTNSESTVNNGVNVEALLGAREVLSDAPEAAQFSWRASCEWKKGTHSKTVVEGYYGLGEEHSHKTSFSFDADHPETFAAEDNGATPVEPPAVHWCFPLGPTVSRKNTRFVPCTTLGVELTLLLASGSRSAAAIPWFSKTGRGHRSGFTTGPTAGSCFRRTT